MSSPARPQVPPQAVTATRSALLALIRPPPADPAPSRSAHSNAPDAPAALPPPPFGTPHGYERMASIRDAAQGLTLQNLTENVSSALAIPRKSAAADLGCKEVCAHIAASVVASPDAQTCIFRAFPETDTSSDPSLLPENRQIVLVAQLNEAIGTTP